MAIAEHDPAGAYQAMREHIDVTNEILVELLKLDRHAEGVPAL